VKRLQRSVLASIVLTCVPAIALAQSMPQASASPIAPIRIVLTPQTLAGLPRQTMTVTEEHGTTATYSGVDMDAVLVAAGAPKGTAIGGNTLATYVLVRAADGYRAVFTLPELDGAFTDRVTLLADQRNGVSLPSGLGPFRIIVPGEKRHARWVHAVTEIDLIAVP
jgi:hypothetical protein